MVRSNTENSVSIGIYDDVGLLSVSVPAQTLAANTWTRVSVSKTFNAAAIDFYAALVANQACIFYFNEPQMNVGSTSAAFAPGPYSDAARIMMETDNDNYLYNGGFEKWTLSTQPDGWALVGAPTVIAYAALGLVGDGGQAAELTLDPDEGIRQYLGVVTGGGLAANILNNEKRIVSMLWYKYVTFAVDILRMAAGGSDPIRIGIYDRDNAGNTEEGTVDVYPETSVWSRYYVTKRIQNDATQVYVEVADRTIGSAGQHILVDSAMVNVGKFPMQYRASMGWRQERWDFGYNGAAADTQYCSIQGVAGGLGAARYPLCDTADQYVIGRIAARCMTAPAVSGVFTLGIDGDGTLGVTLTNPAVEADNHITSYTTATYHCDNYLESPFYSAGGGANEATNTVISVWGYYYER
jgi:hypothetical protein